METWHLECYEDDFKGDLEQEKTEDSFITRDIITGRKGDNPLNKEHLSKEELDDLFLLEEWV